ncbi:DAP3-binding cell death enhancer 1-like [Culicoides brevitarsis]|uniref:DAP3-binding cell death enhancer 1-like n=1 Tax=Culicoides brevitarsis TaxID=469753 RepID=UPI00307C112D
MYRYVLRRLRDIVEKTYSVLDAQKTWTCNKSVENSSGSHCAPHSNSTNVVLVRPAFTELCSTQKSEPNRDLCFIPERKDAGGSGPNRERCHKEHERQQCDFTWVSALTWSSALVCGWYASQLLCLHRRNPQHRGWDSRCAYSRVFMNTNRALHTTLLARLAFASSPLYEANQQQQPTRQFHRLKRAETPDSQNSGDSGVFDAKPSRSNSPQFDFLLHDDHEELRDLHKYVINVSNDEETYVEKPKKTEKSQENDPSTVEQAVQNLLSVIGEIEFQLGIKSIRLGDYSTAVSHLKLATSHHHAAATFNLGVCAENGIGCKKDLAFAMSCYQAATDLGHPQAMYNLGVFYAQGLGGLKKSRKAARKLFETAALMGVIEAKAALGLPIVDLPGLQKTMTTEFGAMNYEVRSVA